MDDVRLATAVQLLLKVAVRLVRSRFLLHEPEVRLALAQSPKGMALDWAGQLQPEQVVRVVTALSSVPPSGSQVPAPSGSVVIAQGSAQGGERLRAVQQRESLEQ